MASKARFGRLPRSAPSLTSTLVSLANQFQSQRDSNIETAWKTGGQFEGKAVTDKMFLDHWKERMSSVSQDDPMWDYYNNLVQNYTFTIAESKMGLKYAGKQVTDHQMAQFYMTWARKLPVDSEAYRNLATQAAKFQTAATSRANSGRAGNASAAYNRAQTSTYMSTEQPYNVATNLIMRYALDHGYIDAKDYASADNGFSKLTNAAGENDPANFSNMLTDLANDPNVSKAMTAAIRANGDPHFSGAFNIQTLSTLANNARNGATIGQNRALATGHKQDATDAGKRKDTHSLQATVIGISLGQPGHESFVQQNDFYRSQLDLVLAPNSGASSLERKLATDNYNKWLGGAGMQTFLSTLPAGAVDPLSANFNPTAAGIYGRIQNTLSAFGGFTDKNGNPIPPKATGQTLKDDLFGFSTAQAGPTSDAFISAQNTNGLLTGLNGVAKGDAIEVRTNAKGVPDPNGDTWTIFPKNTTEVVGNDNLIPFPTVAHGVYNTPDGKATVGADQGDIRFTVATPVGVSVTSQQDPNTGAFTTPNSPTQGFETGPGGKVAITGKQVMMPGPNGVDTPIWGTYQNGRLIWSMHDPYKTSGDESITTAANGTVVHNYSLGQQPGPNAPGVKPQTFDPTSMIDGQYIKQPGDPTWHPNDKQTGWDSPMSAFANSSPEAMQHTIDLGPAVNKVETAWFSDPKNWTPTMKQQAQSGVKPEDVVSQKAGELIDQVYYNAAFGITPSDQQATRKMYDQQDLIARSERTGKPIPEGGAISEQQQRADLTAQLTQWGIDNTVKPQTYYNKGTGQQVQLGGGKNPLPQNWSVGDLLNQPGMSLNAARDLAYQITSGSANPIGAPLIGPQVPSQAALGPVTPGGRLPARGAGPLKGPFAPTPGSSGPSFRLGPNATGTPPTYTPSPATAAAKSNDLNLPKPTPKPLTPSPATAAAKSKDLDLPTPTITAPLTTVYASDKFGPGY